METSIPAAQTPLQPSSSISPAMVAYPTIAQSWGMLGWVVMLNVVGVLIELFLTRVLQAPKQLTTVIMTVLVDAALIIILLRKAKRQRCRVSLQFTGQELPWLYAALPVLVLAQLVLFTPLILLHLPDWADPLFREGMQQPLLVFLQVCVIAPLFEEVVFRGLVLDGLLRNYRPWIAIGQSALLFGLVHMNPAQIVDAGLAGVLLGWLYYRTQSLWVCIAVHALHNLVGFMVMRSAYPNDFAMVRALVGSDIGYILAVAVSALLLAVVLWRVRHTTTLASSGATLPTQALNIITAET